MHSGSHGQHRSGTVVDRALLRTCFCLGADSSVLVAFLMLMTSSWSAFSLSTGRVGRCTSSPSMSYPGPLRLLYLAQAEYQLSNAEKCVQLTLRESCLWRYKERGVVVRSTAKHAMRCESGHFRTPIFSLPSPIRQNNNKWLPSSHHLSRDQQRLYFDNRGRHAANRASPDHFLGVALCGISLMRSNSIEQNTRPPCRQ